ncbi:NADH:ubiquinone oxidoreductase, partial [bacterium]
MKETIIPIGPFHPLLEEPELFTLKVDGETVVDVDMKIGWNHRG